MRESLGSALGGDGSSTNFMHLPLLPSWGIFFFLFLLEAKLGGPRGGHDILKKMKISSVCGESKLCDN